MGQTLAEDIKVDGEVKYAKDTVVTKEILEDLKTIFNNGYNMKIAKINEELDTFGSVQTVKIYNPTNKVHVANIKNNILNPLI